ncbi:MAG: HAD family hydrolase [Meiothermus sp.]|uniref:HAD family hydrolase n=1 Tax=Meiothermus sp. TaxID=1955249 RepID=UPI0028CECA82|nr:HAD family hydrolase [Meiothermus sp.]MDT7921054.1 HAD family hydrolase [Meiothermus sp.]
MRWLTFDLDGTLADWPFRRLMRPYMQALLVQPAVRQALREEHLRRLAQGDHTRVYDWGDIYQVVREKLGLAQAFPSITQVLAEAVLEPEVLYPDVPAGLAALRQQGYRIAIATNGLARYQRVLVDKLNIAYEQMLAPDISHAIKPDPAFWNPLRSQVPEAIVHVGDLLSQDIWGANAAGLTAVWIWREMPPDWRTTPVAERTQRPDLRLVIADRLQRELEEYGQAPFRPQTLPQPDHIVADLEELAAILEPTSPSSDLAQA